jgi:UDP-GlcNAc:undecaprenyl-phosphate GlcNAc-1-phosphate transferase
VLIYGAGDAGDLLLRELSNNRMLRRHPVAFVDDDRLKQGKLIHGLRVFGGDGTLPQIIKQHRIDEVIISSNKLSQEKTREIARRCGEAQVALQRMHIQFEQLDENTDQGVETPA